MDLVSQNESLNGFRIVWAVSRQQDLSNYFLRFFGAKGSRSNLTQTKFGRRTEQDWHSQLLKTQKLWCLYTNKDTQAPKHPKTDSLPSNWQSSTAHKDHRLRGTAKDNYMCAHITTHNTRYTRTQMQSKCLQRSDCLKVRIRSFMKGTEGQCLNFIYLLIFTVVIPFQLLISPLNVPLMF